MSIASAPFLFLFLPLSIGVYYLIPKKQGAGIRNLFLVLASLFFYTWGEPSFILLLVGMIFLTWCFGRMAYGRKGTRTGKTAVCLTVIINVTVILLLGKQEFFLNLFGNVLGKDLSYLMTEFPIGFSFFIFSSISYVVDMYRGQCQSKGGILQAALYTSVFFKVLQGPIISYRKFETQITEREESFDSVAEGLWRFSIGLCKKIIIANNLSYMVNGMLSLDFSSMMLGDAWIGCISYLVYLYFDLSGYADMAIGLARVFGFSMPENFNYPYISKSISEFWRRWHITLCVWFTEYLYYPILLGPSVRLRKSLLQRNVSPKAAKTLQNIFVPACVWTVTALWHGMNLNFSIWGLINCAGMLIEPHIKPIGNKRAGSALRHVGMFFFLVLSMPLIGIGSFEDALLFYKAMAAGTVGVSAYTIYSLENFGLFLVIGIIGCFPVVPYIKGKVLLLSNGRGKRIWDVCAAVSMAFLVVVSLFYLFTRGTVLFLYQ